MLFSPQPFSPKQCYTHVIMKTCCAKSCIHVPKPSKYKILPQTSTNIFLLHSSDAYLWEDKFVILFYLCIFFNASKSIILCNLPGNLFILTLTKWESACKLLIGGDILIDVCLDYKCHEALYLMWINWIVHYANQWGLVSFYVYYELFLLLLILIYILA